MSQLSKSLEKRIQELTSSIESQKTELAAYERVLHMELAKENAPAETVTIAPEIALAISAEKAKAVEPSAVASVSEVEYAGNKTALVADIVKSFGSAGAAPKDVDAFFNAKNIKRSTNLVYNTLSYLVARKRLVRRNGKYFLPGTTTPAAKKKTPAKKKTAAPAKRAAQAPTKRRLSPEGLKRIKEALKKRWADKRAAEAAAAAKKK